MQNESMIIEFFNDFIKFRNTSIKFYFDDNDDFIDDSIFIISTNSINLSSNEFNILDIRDHLSTSSATTSIISTSIKRDRDRSKKYFVQINFNSNICFIMNEDLHNFDDENNDEHNSMYTITSIQGTHTADIVAAINKNAVRHIEDVVKNVVQILHEKACVSVRKTFQGTHIAIQGIHIASFSDETGDAVWLIKKEKKLKKKK